MCERGRRKGRVSHDRSCVKKNTRSRLLIRSRGNDTAGREIDPRLRKNVVILETCRE